MAPFLSAYLDRLARRSWAWGSTDCLLILADWIAMARGVDPGAPYRGTYASEAECLALLAREGGLRRILARALARHGIGRTSEPRAGDVGLVVAPTYDGTNVVGGIRIDGGWVVMTPDLGAVAAPLRCLGAWRI